MELIRGLHNLREHHFSCVLTVGKLDGVHLGHQCLLARLREHAGRLDLPSTVMTFEPTPQEYFGAVEQPRVITLRDKLALLEAQGIDRLLIVRFDQRIAALAPDEFIDKVLIGRIGARLLVVGDDFRFGKRRSGSVEMLESRSVEIGIAIHRCDGVSVDGERVSSTALREALAQADLARATAFLGRPYSLRGRVRRGLQLGRKLGMPTANIELHHKLALRQGVYAVRVRAGEANWDGVASLGVRPTLGMTRCLLETHIFGDCGSLYGRELEVEFRAFLRPQLKFDSLDALAAQMQQDGLEARRLLATI